MLVWMLTIVIAKRVILSNHEHISTIANHCCTSNLFTISPNNLSIVAILIGTFTVIEAIIGIVIVPQCLSNP
jgi:hypothetical protein